MILADTSVWIYHFRQPYSFLREYLDGEQLLMHPFVAGELACGNLKERASTLMEFQRLPRASTASNAEVMALIESSRLYGRGIGWTDAHLLASALVSNCVFWTLDQRLASAATDLGIPCMRPV